MTKVIANASLSFSLFHVLLEKISRHLAGAFLKMDNLCEALLLHKATGVWDCFVFSQYHTLLIDAWVLKFLQIQKNILNKSNLCAGIALLCSHSSNEMSSFNLYLLTVICVDQGDRGLTNLHTQHTLVICKKIRAASTRCVEPIILHH